MEMALVCIFSLSFLRVLRSMNFDKLKQLRIYLEVSEYRRTGLDWIGCVVRNVDVYEDGDMMMMVMPGRDVKRNLY